MRWNEFGKFLIVALAIIGGFCVYISPLANSIKQGLDLQGGTHVVLQAVDTPELKVDDDAVNRSVKVIERRVNELGLTEPVIQRQGEDRIAIDLPGVEDPEAALDLIGRTAVLDFRQVLGESPRVPAQPIRSNYDNDEQFKAAQGRWQQAKNEVDAYILQMKNAVKSNPDVIVANGEEGGAYLLGTSADVALDLLKERMLLARDVIGAVEQTINSF